MNKSPEMSKLINNEMKIDVSFEEIMPNNMPMTGTNNGATRALKLVNQERNSSYGPPEDNFKRTADLLYAAGFRNSKGTMTAKDIAMIMMLVKLAREVDNHKEDNLDDTIGYALLLERLHKLDAKTYCAPAQPTL